MTRWFAVSSGQARVSHSDECHRLGMSRHHEHLLVPAETLGAVSSGFYREARVFIHAFFVPRQLQQVAAAFTRARVDPRVSGYWILSAALFVRITAAVIDPRVGCKTLCGRQLPSQNYTDSNQKSHVAIRRQEPSGRWVGEGSSEAPSGGRAHRESAGQAH